MRRLPVLDGAIPGPGPGEREAGGHVPCEAREGAIRGRYYIETWGCQMNVYDSERFAGQFQRLGYLPAPSEEEADVVLLNTCSVRERAEEKLYSKLGRLRSCKRANPDLLVGVAGCVAQQEQTRLLARSPVVSFVIGTGAVAQLPRLLEGARGGRRELAVEMGEERFDEPRPLARGTSVRAYVTVMEGCNKSCSFCVVPFTRGSERSRSPEAIVGEMEEAVGGGAREIELLGQNVNAYRHGGCDFAGLLRRTGRVPGVRRLRFATSHPRELTDGVIEAMSEGPPICDALHLPVQSGSNRVLRWMARGYDRDRYLSRIRKLRRSLPGVGLSTDVIVGFPGETEEDFKDTLQLLAEVEFDQVFAFVYSPRPHTRASALSDPEPRERKEERLQRLFALQDAISLARNQALVGLTLEVLVEGPAKSGRGMVSGRTTRNRVVNLPGAPRLAGQLVDVRVIHASPHSLRGELADPPVNLRARTTTAVPLPSQPGDPSPWP